MSAPSRFHGRLTRLGVHCLLLGCFAVFGGAIRGFNLLLVLAALLLGALLIQWRWSRDSIAAMDVRRRLPVETLAGKPFSVRFQLNNHNRFLTAWMLRLSDSVQSVSGSSQATGRSAIASVRPGQVAHADYHCLIACRGRYRFGPIELETTFPFFLFRCRKKIFAEDEICVLPRPLNLRRDWHQRLSFRESPIATRADRSGANEGEFFGLREWRNGDSRKWIHWRTTARLQEPAVRQFEQQLRFNFCIVIDAYAESESDSHDAEIAISLAATFVAHLAANRSNRIVLGAAGASESVAVGGDSSQAGKGIAILLAEIQVNRRPRITEATQRAIEIAGQVDDLIVISSRSQAKALEASAGQPDLRSKLTSRCHLRWIDVSSDQLDDWILKGAR